MPDAEQPKPAATPSKARKTALGCGIAFVAVFGCLGVVAGIIGKHGHDDDGATGGAASAGVSTPADASPRGKLVEAIKANDLAQVTDLLAHTPDLVNATKDSVTPLHVATDQFKDTLHIVELLVAKGANVNAMTGAGMTPLWLARWQPDTRMTTFLLDHGADLNKHCPKVLSPLGNFASMGRIELVRLFLDHGADVNAADSEGWTPLHAAASRNRLAVAELLISRGASMNLRAKANINDTEPRFTPLGLALKEGHREVAALLESHGGTE